MPDCAGCDDKKCYSGTDCYDIGETVRSYLEGNPESAKFHRVASSIEANHYCEATRLEEVILFAEAMGYKKLGLAFCIGMQEEVKQIAEILSEHFTVHSVCCKTGGVFKDDFGYDKIRRKGREVMCNPFGQAMLLNRMGCELNVICGLCVGHDALFSKQSDAPVVTLIAKDRVLAHNPVAAVTCPYLRRRFDRK